MTFLSMNTIRGTAYYEMGHKSGLDGLYAWGIWNIVWGSVGRKSRDGTRGFF